MVEKRLSSEFSPGQPTHHHPVNRKYHDQIEKMVFMLLLHERCRVAGLGRVGGVWGVHARVAHKVLLRKTVQQHRQYNEAANELSAATSLLRLTCDAVVELDEDHC